MKLRTPTLPISTALIFRDSDQGVEGFRDYMRRTFDPKEPLIAEFVRVATGKTTVIH